MGPNGVTLAQGSPARVQFRLNVCLLIAVGNMFFLFPTIQREYQPSQKKVLKQTANIQTCCCLIHALDSLQKELKKHGFTVCCALIAPFLAPLERHYIAHVGSILV